MATLRLENVHKNYGILEDAVKGISFTCNDGELMVLLGPSGCGKTTTLRMIAGLESVTDGVIKIDGKVINNLAPQQRNVAMAFETYALYPLLSVYKNIAFPLQVMKLSKAEIDRRVREVAEVLSITDILNNLPGRLSGGEKQRVSLARALVREPTIFLIDEPLSHIDADLHYRARALIKHIHVTTGTTMVYVTHNQKEAVALADRLILMNLGMIQQIGTPQDLYYHPVNLFVASFISEPPMNTILTRLEMGESLLLLHLQGEGQVILHFSVDEIPSCAQHALYRYHGKEIIMGVRPQNVRIQHSAKGGGILKQVPGKLLVYELLVNEGIAQVLVNGNKFECVTPLETTFRASDAVRLAMDFADLYFFDPQTTNHIEYKRR